ncbi:unnamed protein product, partial [Tuber aestivum]
MFARMSLLNPIHSHTIPFCEIRLNDDIALFRGTPEESAGVMLSGTLVFSVKEPVPVRSISLSLVGWRRLHWQERTSTGSIGIPFRSVKSESVVFEKKWDFLGFSHSNPVTLGPDNYECSFSTVLPGDLPESIVGLEHAQVFYRLKAVIERPLFAQNITAKKHLRVVWTLGPSALELSQTASVEKIWPDKVEYSISTPSKAVIFGSSIPIDITLVPLLKGLTVEKVICDFKELHNFSHPERGTTKNDTRHILQQTFENWGIEVEDDDEDFGSWRLQGSVDLPKSLVRCVQDCEGDFIEVSIHDGSMGGAGTTVNRNLRLRFVVKLRNPDGHASEIHTSLPVQLFISPNLLMDEDNVIHRTASSRDLALPQSQAPPRYDEHYLDQLYDGLPQDHYGTPMQTPLPSRPHSPNLLQQNSSENLAPFPPSGSGRSVSSMPPRTPSHGGTGGASAPLAPPTSPAGVTGEGEAAQLGRHGSGDYFSRPAGLGGHATHYSGPRMRAHSSDNLPGGELDLNTISRVPSYSAAVRSGTGNLSSASSLPTYDDRLRSAPGSPAGRPLSSQPRESFHDTLQTEAIGRGRGEITADATPVELLILTVAEGALSSQAERRLRRFWLRGR